MRKFELRPEALASLASRFLVSGLRRMLRVALIVFAMNTDYHTRLKGDLSRPRRDGRLPVTFLSLPHPRSQSSTAGSVAHSAIVLASARPDSCFRSRAATPLESFRPPSAPESCLREEIHSHCWRLWPDAYPGECPPLQA